MKLRLEKSKNLVNKESSKGLFDLLTALFAKKIMKKIEMREEAKRGE